MELWIIFAIFSAILGGIFNFILKVAAHKNYEISEVLVCTYFSSFLLGSGLLWYKFTGFNNLWLVVFYALLNGGAYFFVHRIRIRSLKYIDTAIYFPVYKTIGPIMILGISFLFFHENLNFTEWVGVVLGIVTSWLLISKKENERQKNLKKGLSLMFIGTILTTFGVGINKVVNVFGLNKELFLVVTIGFLLIMTILTLRKERKRSNQKTSALFKNKRIIYLGLFNGVIVFATAYFMLLALEGNTAVVYTINSFSILITVMLSVFFFKEHFNIRKALAVIASVLAGIFFIK